MQCGKICNSPWRRKSVFPNPATVQTAFPREALNRVQNPTIHREAVCPKHIPEHRSPGRARNGSSPQARFQIMVACLEIDG